MKSLTDKIKEFKKSGVRKAVENRLCEFAGFRDRPSEEWFSELCFCILTANSRAETAINIQAELGPEGFFKAGFEDVRDCIIRNKHRFHNNKARFIIAARPFIDIKDRIKKIINDQGEDGGREWIVRNVKGIGYKEASHFLRNVGYTGLAILDRHIINLMIEDSLIQEKPKSLSGKNYIDIENKFKALSDSLNMSPAELDLYMWCLKTGKVLK